MSSAAEAEVAGVFVNTKEGTTIQTTLEELGYPQPPTPVQVDNTTAVGIANDTVKQRSSKPSTCDFTGFGTGSNRANFIFTGRQANTTLPTILPNITQVHIINRNAHITFTLDNLHHTISKLQCHLT